MIILQYVCKSFKKRKLGSLAEFLLNLFDLFNIVFYWNIFRKSIIFMIIDLEKYHFELQIYKTTIMFT